MASYNKFNCYTQDLHEGKHDFRTDNLRLALSNTQPSPSNSLLADIAEIEAGGGYSAGGFGLSILSSAQVDGLYKLVVQDLTFTAGGTVQPFRYSVIYNASSAEKNLLGWLDHQSTTNLRYGESYFFDFNQDAGLFQME